MRISPHDIRQQQFTVRMFRGTDARRSMPSWRTWRTTTRPCSRSTQLLKEQLAAMEDRRAACSTASGVCKRRWSRRSGWSRR